MSKEAAVGAKPTIYDVAARAGVSIATVSRAIRKPDSVRGPTRELVEHAINDLGYVPSGSARSLAGHRTGIIGLFLPNVDAVEDLHDFRLSTNDSANVTLDPSHTETKSSDSLYFDEVLRGCELESWRRGMSLMVNIGRGRSEPDVVHVVNDMAGKVDGLVILAGSVPDRAIEFLHDRIPLVLVADAPSDNGQRYDLVRVSNRKGMRTLTEHLIDAHGVSDFAYIAGPDKSPDNRKRYVGFQEGLAARGINPASVPIYRGDFSFVTAYGIARDLEARGAVPRALVCANDQMALGVLKALNDEGLRVPQDVIVTGFDGIAETNSSSPRITTIRQPMLSLGRGAVSTIMERIATPDAPPLTTELPVTVLLRESCEGAMEADAPDAAPSMTSGALPRGFRDGVPANRPSGGSAVREDGPRTARSVLPEQFGV
ncbi:LacI family DNA-binding transcriptional regulator [uncultured Bifidobacterium sp.]|uniref:LacI family DNA-binding transcriptional regulator n=1 Tax=uncultured Bifidobacterium sp. TaxID=165187 RepID=UPI0028DB9FB7|nr:LacI family DNA-binding transcriptional regulator [uncultured Bifidobacterium sp.]